MLHALHFSLHQERACVGASHWQFWSLAGGKSRTRTARDAHATASGYVSYRAGVLVLATKGTRIEETKARPQQGYAKCRAKR
jgi:hypothetical protein